MKMERKEKKVALEGGKFNDRIYTLPIMLSIVFWYVLIVYNIWNAAMVSVCRVHFYCPKVHFLKLAIILSYL